MPLRPFFYPYRLERVPPHSIQLDGRLIELSVGWRLERKPEYPVITVKLNNRTLGVTFQRETAPADGPFPGEVRATWCELHRLDSNGKSEAIVARTRARCARSDNFNKDVGRKVSLARALKQYGLTRLDRTLVWFAYHERPRPVSKPKATPQPVEEAMVNILDLTDNANQQADGFREINQRFVGLDLNAGEVH